MKVTSLQRRGAQEVDCSYVLPYELKGAGWRFVEVIPYGGGDPFALDDPEGNEVAYWPYTPTYGELLDAVKKVSGKEKEL